MAYSVPLTAVSNASLTAAQWNASVRDNMLETPAAKFTAAGQLFVSTGPNAGAVRTIAAGRTTGGAQGITGTAFGDLTTVGPTLSNVVTGTSCLVIVTAFVSNNTAGQGGYMGYTISGATARAASVDRTLRIMATNAGERYRASSVNWETGLNPGTHTFQAKYASVNTGTADFDERELAVIPL
jgi:hypothetical protein